MKKTVLLSAIASFLMISVAVQAQSRIETTDNGPWQPSDWPVLKHYDAAHLHRIALPLGGIGTGQVSLGGRGELCDWEIMNYPGKGYSATKRGTNNAPLFAIYVRRNGEDPKAKILAGPLYTDEYLHYEGGSVSNHGYPRFSQASFDAAYPFGQVNLSDPGMPVKVRIKGFNPLIPGDSEASGLPVAVLSYEVTNSSDAEVEVSVCGAIHNFIGQDGTKYEDYWGGDVNPVGAKKNKNEYKSGNGLKAIYFYSEGVASTDEAWGNMTLATDADGDVSYRTFTTDNNWNNASLNFWDDFSDDGRISNPLPNPRWSIGGADDPMGAIAVRNTLAPGETRCFNFYLTWNFPNRRAWYDEEIVGNWYSQRYPDSWESAKEIIPQIPGLEQRTLAFVNALLGSSLPEVAKEAALFNLNVLRSQTVFRIADGHMMGWEGVRDREGSCQGSCTHVWNYEVATPFLFGDLARTMRNVEFKHALHEDGRMDFRALLPLDTKDYGNAAADGQMGCIMKLYREWQLSGDNAFLADYWEACKKALSYAWVERGWDGNCDGVMEGSQHNTMDVNYFGPNPQMAFWYLGALRAAEEMALAMKDKAFATKCRYLFDKGSAWVDANLFNGEYYEHKITDPETFEFLPEGSDKVPPFQLGKGCLVDQLVGQYMAHICGLGYLGDKEHMRTTLESIMRYNWRESMTDHFNNMRSYVLGDESCLLMASWPKGRLEVPFPYFPEAMTGFEYAAAIGMIYEGMEADGLKCIKAIRDRFDGAKRNPFSEPECGHHYARSMASWAAVIALSEFHWSGVDGTFSITDKPGTWFWSNGYAWGTATVSHSDAVIKVIEGQLPVKSVKIGDKVIKIKKGSVMPDGSISLSF